MTEEKAVTTMTEEGVPVLTLEPLEQTALAEPAPAEVEPMLTEDTLTPEEARTYIGEGQFAPGSMLPKVEAAVKFAESKPGRTALITLLEKARDGIDGKTGTRITC